jgi:large subunit ribosomal protein L17
VRVYFPLVFHVEVGFIWRIERLYVLGVLLPLDLLNEAMSNAQSQTGLLTYLQTPHELLPKLFGPLRERYANRPGGYTRVLRVEPKKDDHAPSAILELVDGPKDMRFALTAKTLARQRSQGIDSLNELTALNVKKVTRFRKGGVEALEQAVKKMELKDRKSERDVSEGKKENA